MSSDTNPPPATEVKAGDEPGQSKPLPWYKSIDPRVFIPAGLIIVTLIALATIFSNVESGVVDEDGEQIIGEGDEPISVAENTMATINDWVTESLGWYYVVIVAFFIVAALAFGLSRFGKLRLSKSEDDRPEFSRASWFAMLFSAGMGIGLVFYGASEPLIHLNVPPYLPENEAGSIDAARDSMLATFMHWGIHAWAIYVVLGLAIAFTVHRKGRPVSIRWVLEPLLGDRVKGTLGDLIDVTAVVATLFGVATSLGIGASQISSGLNALGFEFVALGDNGLNVVVIAFITILALWSVVSGVKRGMKWLSNLNMVLAGFLLLFFIIAGPTLFIFRDFFTGIGYYFQNILAATFNAGAFPVEEGATAAVFQTGWTIFYWGWWISWAPFVAVFIARISKGRTVREFVIGVLLVPTIVSFIWFTALGGTGIHQQVSQGESFAFINDYDEAAGLFQVLANMPLTSIVTGVCVILVITFFVTSSDSGSLVIDMLSSGGNIEPPKTTRAFWAVLEGAAAALLLLAGGLEALKIFAIILALPFSIILVMSCFATWKGLRKEYDEALIKRAGGPPKVTADAPKS